MPDLDRPLTEHHPKERLISIAIRFQQLKAWHSGFLFEEQLALDIATKANEFLLFLTDIFARVFLRFIHEFRRMLPYCQEEQ